MYYVASTIMVLVSLVGIGLTLVTLPGAWIMLAAAVLCNVWQTGMYSWWTLGVGLGIAVAAEIAELAASAVGAKKTGGSRAAAVGSLVGAILGAVAGTPIVPVVGTVAGAVLGAAAGALIAELGIANKTWRDSAKVAGGAAAGRLVATVVKTGATAAIAVMLIVGIFVA